MRAFSLFALATAVCLSACAPKPMKVVLEPLPMRYGDNSKVKDYPFAKDPTVIHHGDQYFMY